MNSKSVVLGGFFLLLVLLLSSFTSTFAQPLGPPTPGLPVEVFVDPAPDQDWEPYTETIYIEQAAGFRPLTAEKSVIRQTTSDTTDFVELDTLIVIYSDSAMGHLEPQYVERVKEQVRESAKFFWRHSHLKLYLNLTFVVVDDQRDASEFEYLWSTCYWLMPYDGDGDGKSVENDLLALGFTENQFDSINLFFGGDGGTLPPCAGGLAWGAWPWGHLGDTQFTGNLVGIGWDVWQPFGHEFQHSIDDMFRLAGRPQYFHPDFPQDTPGRFGHGPDFHMTKMREWPVDDWFDLLEVWGNYRQAPDADQDGVPDGSPDLYITEEALGSDPGLPDSDSDGFGDLKEAMGGMWRASDAMNVDTDGDGRIDGNDQEPIYPLEETIRFRSHELDGRVDGWSVLMNQVAESTTPFNASLAADWDDDNLYLMLQMDRPSRIILWLDVAGNGFFHGYGYEIVIDPTRVDPLVKVHVQDCSRGYLNAHDGICRYDDYVDYPWGRLVTEEDLNVIAKPQGNGHLVQLAIPKNNALGLSLDAHHEIGMSILFHDIDYNWRKRAWLFEEEDLVYLRLLLNPSISGRVTAEVDGSELEGINVEVYSQEDGLWTYASSAYTAADGTYEVNGLPTGTYRLGFFDWSRVYVDEYYDNAPDLQSATTVSVTAGATTNIDMQLARSGSITGIVTSEADSVELEGIYVEVYSQEDDQWTHASSAYTTADGTYEANGLPTGTYRLGFFDWSQVYLHEYFENAPDVNGATNVAVTEGLATTDINVQLAVGGQIAGKVTSEADGSDLAGIRVDVYRQEEGKSVIVQGGYTVGDGSYTITGLNSGGYFVTFMDGSRVYGAEYYDDASTLADATEVPVTIGLETPGIDASLAAPHAPGNDNFGDAYLIDVLPFTFGQVVTGAKTAVGDPELPCGPENQGYGTVWFAFTPGRDTFLTADTLGSSYATVLALWEETGGNLANVACNDVYGFGGDSQIVDVPLAAGKTYYLEIASYSDYLGILNLHVSVQNEQPACETDTYDLLAAETLTVPTPGVLGNDSDPDGDELTAVLSTDVQQGDLELQADGSFTYTPDSGYTGSDSFQYQAYDGVVKSELATVYLKVEQQLIFLPFASGS